MIYTINIYLINGGVKSHQTDIEPIDRHGYIMVVTSVKNFFYPINNVLWFELVENK